MQQAHGAANEPWLSNSLRQHWKAGHSSFALFRTGEKVWRKVQLKGNLSSNKLTERYEGPYKIIRVQPNGVTYVVLDKAGREIKAHHTQLKLYHNPPQYLLDVPQPSYPPPVECEYDEDDIHHYEYTLDCSTDEEPEVCTRAAPVRYTNRNVSHGSETPEAELCSQKRLTISNVKQQLNKDLGAISPIEAGGYSAPEQALHEPDIVAVPLTGDDEYGRRDTLSSNEDSSCFHNSNYTRHANLHQSLAECSSELESLLNAVQWLVQSQEAILTQLDSAELNEVVECATPESDGVHGNKEAQDVNEDSLLQGTTHLNTSGTEKSINLNFSSKYRSYESQHDFITHGTAGNKSKKHNQESVATTPAVGVSDSTPQNANSNSACSHDHTCEHPLSPDIEDTIFQGAVESNLYTGNPPSMRTNAGDVTGGQERPPTLPPLLRLAQYRRRLSLSPAKASLAEAKAILEEYKQRRRSRNPPYSRPRLSDIDNVEPLDQTDPQKQSGRPHTRSQGAVLEHSHVQSTILEYRRV